MERKKGWLQEVLDEASADVKTWPPWLKDKDEDTYQGRAASDHEKSDGKLGNREK